MKLITIKIKLIHLCREDHEQDVEQCFHDEEHRPNQTKQIFMKSMGKIKSQLKRCRVLKLMNKVESIFKWQIMAAEHVEE